ncbi:hypothetical protein JS756_28735 [Streptomyces actuosus]|uniref:Thiazolylpeptide-type bacteriocin n=1 Tax=Streptomyces actuosus TaxID=1885 RepID=A0ABS2VY04_STRAS|nr:thiopeptide-type bacteriocin [Streptomyces actuosus]MBN0048027.1 hypothetical protein [Streptomyces actuosus]
MSQTATEFAAFDLEDLKVLDVNDAVALPEMGASIIINNAEFVDDAEDVVDGAALDAASISSSSSCCCC